MIIYVQLGKAAKLSIYYDYLYILQPLLLSPYIYYLSLLPFFTASFIASLYLSFCVPIIYYLLDCLHRDLFSPLHRALPGASQYTLFSKSLLPGFLLRPRTSF